MAGVQALRGDRTRPDDVARLVEAGPWDAVVDTSGYVPREVLAVCERLEPATGRYVFLSTVSVYRGWPAEPLAEESEVLYCPPDAGPGYGEDVEDGPTRYGYQKSGCELAVAQTFGAGRSTCLRPGVVLGPREYVGRLPWLGAADLDVLATQLTAALDGPLLLYLSSAILTQAAPQVSERLGRGWEDLIQRVCRSR